MEIINGNKVNGVLITKDKINNTLSINVSVEPFSVTGNAIRLTTKDIIPFLTITKELEIGGCIQSSVISSTSDNSLFGTWVFQLPPKLENLDKTIINSINTTEIINEPLNNISEILSSSLNKKQKKIKKEI